MIIKVKNAANCIMGKNLYVLFEESYHQEKTNVEIFNDYSGGSV